MDEGAMSLDWPYLYYSNRGRLDVSDPERPVAVPMTTYVIDYSDGTWAVKNGVGYSTAAPSPKSPCSWTFIVTGVDKDWEEPRKYFDFLGYGSPPQSYEMAWDTYVMVGAGFRFWPEPGCTGYFQIVDFSQFSFATGEGPVSVIYSDLQDAYDSAYHEGEGVIYVARGSGGLDVMEAPFPTLNRHLYFPLAARPGPTVQEVHP